MKISASERALAAGLFACLLWAAPVAAQPVDDSTRNAARELASQAAEAFQKGDYQRAQDLYHRAYALLPAPTLSLREARALEKLGKLVEAVEAYVRTTRTLLDADAPQAFRQAVQSAEEELAKLRPRVPKLEIVLEGADASVTQVTLDGKVLKSALIGVAQPVNPGTHEIEGVTQGKSGKTSIKISEGVTKSVTLTLTDDPNAVSPEPAEPEPAPGAATPVVDSDSTADAGGGFPHATLGWVSLGVGAAGLGVGVVTGLMATSRHASAEDGCPNGKCPAGSQAADDLDAFRTLRTVSTIGYAVGVVGVAAGVTLLLTAPSKPESAHVAPYIGPASAGVAGRF
jgi:hypothetical protein